jgi:hypothetical protein
MIKKIDFKTILIEVLSLLLFIHGIKRLFFATKSDLIEASLEGDFESLGINTVSSMSAVILDFALASFIPFIIGIVVIGIINSRFKISYLNTIVIFVIVYLLLHLQLLQEGYMNSLLNSLGYLFSNDLAVSLCIGGTILTLTSIFILIFLVRYLKKEVKLISQEEES